MFYVVGYLTRQIESVQSLNSLLSTAEALRPRPPVTEPQTEAYDVTSVCFGTRNTNYKQ